MDTYLGTYQADLETMAARLARQDIIKRIWQRDHTVWQDNPTEIDNRLGWLDIIDLMRRELPALVSFANDIRRDKFRHVVLLGMGGSSLGAEVMRQIFGCIPDYPELIVLDSSLPECVLATASAIDPRNTLFLVSSKSGTTVETVSAFHYFRDLVRKAVGEKRAEEYFVAITDPATPLAKSPESYRRVFLNPPDIGGRYSVLSFFGLVPGVLTGVDPETLLDRADRMRKLCAVETPLDKNPGAWLGTVMGALGQKGCDKLTLITSPAISGFGLWLEQLVAESLGKDGKGIIPVAGEPPVPPDSYGADRLFVYLRLENSDNRAADGLVEQLKSRKRPVVIIKLRDYYDLGSEYYRWEFATAVAASVLKVNPFDQPDVEAAKKATRKLLQEYTASGQFPRRDVMETFSDLLARVREGMYLAILAYIPQTAETDKMLGRLRYKITAKYHIPTTLGYGPRYLHSTGQLHKGGPATGLFLLLTSEHEKDIPIPGALYTFGVLADAQALGDWHALKACGRGVTAVHLTPGRPEIPQLLGTL